MLPQLKTPSSRFDTIIHMLLHFAIPAIFVALFYRKTWLGAYFLTMATMLVDVDHLLAQPVYAAQRCSIGFHPLHTLWPIIIYVLLCLPAKTRLIGAGLVIHMLLDSIDCQATNGVWSV